MRQEEKELLWAYIIHEEARRENEVIELRNRIRFRSIDQTDCFELILALQRLDDFREFALVIIRLLNLDR